MDVGKILIEFWVDAGWVFEDFRYGFKYLVRKRKQASMRLTPWTSWDWELLSSLVPIYKWGPGAPQAQEVQGARRMEACLRLRTRYIKPYQKS